MKKEPLIFIKHILESIKNIEDFMKGIPRDIFLKNKEKQNAVIRGIEIIGEAAKNIPASFRSKNADIPWRDIQDFRIVSAHKYWEINTARVWDIVEIKLPLLKVQIEKILSTEK